MSKLFGTDGIRGIAYKELTEQLAYNVGLALGYILNRNKDNNKIIIGDDTRESSEKLKENIKNSLSKTGIDIIDLGVIPTPAVSYLVSFYNADAGIMITASHNPYQYNGIKIFNKDGYKLSDELENEIENIINNKNKLDTIRKKQEIIINNYNSTEDYVNHLIKSLSINNISNLKIVVDCANGATYKTAKLLFNKLNLKIKILNIEPDGYNINNNCGSTHIDILKEYVISNKLGLGIAYDGDGDRCILVDNLGNIVDGDYILAILSKYNNYNNMVGTVMSNLGLIKYCNYNNINFISTKVGDRYVLEEMVKNNYKLGGEQSGHIILKDYANTGDGELTSIKILEIIHNTDKSLNDLLNIMNKYPQVLVNIEVDNNKKDIIINNKNIQAKIKEVEKKLGSDYKILVRASGTEPLIRIMIEGKDKSIINSNIKVIKKIILNNM